MINKHSSLSYAYVCHRCGHCQEFSPRFEELAAELGGELLFAKIDGTTNEAPPVFPPIKGINRFPSDSTSSIFGRNSTSDIAGFPVHIFGESDGQDEAGRVQRGQERRLPPALREGEPDGQEDVGKRRGCADAGFGQQRIATVLRDARNQGRAVTVLICDDD